MAATPQEQTFTAYTPSQGKAYAEGRRDYHPNLYRTIMEKHTTTGSQLTTLLDVGCGPGLATRALASHFEKAIGLDPSAGMIAAARSLPNPNSIRYEISSAEELGRDLDPPIQSGSVDLITAATCAHWFDMPRFWPRAAQILKPGGSVAIWTPGLMRIHPSVPNHVAIQKAVDDHEKEYMEPYFAPGNFMVKNLYRDLILPWDLEVPEEVFDEKTLFRKEWDWTEDDGVDSEKPPITMGMVEKLLETASPVTRWKEAHPELVGTEKDAVKVIIAEIKRLLHEVGVEEGKEFIKGVLGGVLLVVKKKV
ncbi:hypothetical protein FKW77_006916 [Venturia effusa]|uniref:Methyltransferase type 11 domain-containing protein n=1 Tax=Venturia effusa TaxID=50376 RepID=A0A517L1I9_9PEZI|nr:hypothetical protein FKW77_006916 [Venturia effusa]